jgi:putative ABC transport system permease protein
MVLLVGAIGFRSLFDDAMTRDAGFETEGRITMSFDPAVAGYDSADVDRFFQTLVDRAREVPGVRSAALTSHLPLTWMEIGLARVVPEGYELPPGVRGIDVYFGVVDPHYFDTLGVPLIAGRGFRETDNAGSTRVAVVNEAFASEYLGPEPLGRRIRFDLDNEPLAEVVGVTTTGKSFSVIEPPVPAILVPLAQDRRDRMTLVAETDGDPAAMAAPLVEEIRRTDPDVLIYRIQTMEEVFEGNSVAMLHVVGRTYDAAAVMGLVLALVGLYAILSYQVSRRIREIGIRMALGAKKAEIMLMFLKRAAAIAATGIAIGIVLSLVAGSSVETSLGESSMDPTPLILIAVCMLATTLAASAIPARRAARIDPQEALRQE